jgi:BCCT family betaine/carnitine transporter
VLKKHVDGVLGKIIDVFAIVGLLAGTATTFSLATPLLTQALARVLGIEPTNTLTIIMLVINAIVFTVAVLIGMKAISTVAKTCVIVFIALLTIFFAFGPKVYIIETGVSAIGNVIQNFFKMATWMDPIGASSIGGSTFPQSWTIFYWAYWIAWFVATPFFIGKISEGRTIKQTVLGGLSCGILGTYTSFIVFGGFGLFQQVKGKVDIAGQVAGDPSKVILSIFDQLPTINVVNIFELPITNIALIILVVAMIAFYASTFDAITMVVAGYSVKNLKKDEEPNKRLRIFWAAIFLLLPIALIYANNTLPMLQMISIIAAFPLGLIMILIVYSFFKDMRKDYKAAMGKNKISVIDEVIIEVPEEAEV